MEVAAPRPRMEVAAPAEEVAKRTEEVAAPAEAAEELAAPEFTSFAVVMKRASNASGGSGSCGTVVIFGFGVARRCPGSGGGGGGHVGTGGGGGGSRERNTCCHPPSGVCSYTNHGGGGAPGTKGKAMRGGADVEESYGSCTRTSGSFG